MYGRNLWHLLLCCQVWSLCVFFAAADEIDHQEIRDRLEAARATLVSGEYIAIFKRSGTGGALDADGKRVPISFAEHFQTHLAFDHEKRIFSFNSRSLIPLDDMSRARQQYIKGEDIVFMNNGMQPDSISIKPPGTHRNHTYPKPDVRVFGLAFAEVAYGHSWDDIWKAYVNLPILSVTRLPDSGHIEVKFDDPLKRVLTIDEKRGFWPIKMVGHWDQRIGIQIDIDLVEVDGHWVPQKLVLNDLDSEGNSRRLTMEIEWRSVNQPLPAELFHYRHFEAPAGTRVTDFRQQPSLLLEILREPQAGPFPMHD